MSRKSLITSFSVGVFVFLTISIVLTVFVVKSFLGFILQLLNTL
jgi:hypothetical protein